VVVHKMNRYRKPIIGALVGGSTAGGWLIVDLILPDPIGDYLLFGLMGVVNAGVGWQVARMVDKRQAKKAEPLKHLTTEAN
jgi:hypothetical protein